MTSQTVLLYLLKTILIAGLFLAYYWFALKDKKFHYYNRFYLLSASIISFIAPLLNFNWLTIEEPVLYGSSEIIQFVLPTANVQNQIHFEWTDYVLLGTILIAICLLCLFLFHILRIQYLKSKSEVTRMDGFDFISTNDDNAPFSFLNNLFWKQSISLNEEGGQHIFKHEITHIQQKHSWDRIYCQIVASIFWMNPFNWIIQKELRAIHEFIADEEAVGNSYVEAFAKMLLKTHYGNHFLNPTHQFFYSSIKRRLTMLTKSSNTKYAYLRRVMVLPILFASICLVSIKVHAKEKIEKKVHEIKSSMNLIERELSIQAKKKKVKKSASSDFAIYLDGIILPKKDLKQLSPNMIESMQFIKDKEGLKKYGIEGKNGVVLITSKKGNKSNLQNKVELSTEIIHSKQEGTTIFTAPKIQKDLDTSRNNDPIYYTTDKPAEFPGGSSGWTAYLTKHLNPTIPLKNGAPVGKYKVLLNFVVKSNGGVSNIEVISDPGYGTAAEAIRMIEKGPKWIPAEQNGMKVNYLMKQSFVFVVSND